MAKTIEGRIKSDLRFGSTLTWYTFPVPELDEKTRQRIIKAGKKVLDARALHPERSLGECLMVCVWEPNPHEEMNQNDYYGETRSG